ncbi:DUF6221 family protein [Streptomyces sp. 1222.5]|uniref:DUF6221 family protein n=1 Tax=Streptomyces sp. 1222.5 TaxID=1881026 RepID=UPI003EBC0CBF
MDELVRWLGEQLDEDERIARAAIAAVGDVPGAADWRFGNAYTDEGGTYWQITTMTPSTDGFSLVELVGCGMSGGGAHEPEIARHAVEHDPARVLREIDAKRHMVADYGEALRMRDRLEPNTSGYRHWDNRALGLLHALRHAAAVYTDRPGYAEALAAAKAALLADE